MGQEGETPTFLPWQVFVAELDPLANAVEAVLLGEVVATFTMVTLLCVFLGFRRIRPFTPALFPFLYAMMVPLEAAISAPAPIRPAAWAPPSSRDRGTAGGSTGSGPSSAVFWRASPAACSPNASRSRSCTSSTAIATGFFDQ